MDNLAVVEEPNVQCCVENVAGETLDILTEASHLKQEQNTDDGINDAAVKVLCKIRL